MDIKLVIGWIGILNGSIKYKHLVHIANVSEKIWPKGAASSVTTTCKTRVFLLR